MKSIWLTLVVFSAMIPCAAAEPELPSMEEAEEVPCDAVVKNCESCKVTNLDAFREEPVATLIGCVPFSVLPK